MRKEESLKCIKSSFSNVFFNYVSIHQLTPHSFLKRGVYGYLFVTKRYVILR